MPFKNYRDESRTQWGANIDGNLDREQIALGATLRIADAVEKMATNYATLIDERDRYKRWYTEAEEGRRRAERRIIALRGVITRMKNAPKPARRER